MPNKWATSLQANGRLMSAVTGRRDDDTDGGSADDAAADATTAANPPFVPASPDARRGGAPLAVSAALLYSEDVREADVAAST